MTQIARIILVAVLSGIVTAIAILLIPISGIIATAIAVLSSASCLIAVMFAVFTKTYSIGDDVISDEMFESYLTQTEPARRQIKRDLRKSKIA